MKCTSCNEIHPKIVSLNRIVRAPDPFDAVFLIVTCIELNQEEQRVSTGKDNTAHFVWRCGLCKRESSAKFETSSPPQPYPADANGQFSPLIIIDCRGLEFISFDPRVSSPLSAIACFYIFSLLARVSGNARVSNPECHLHKSSLRVENG